LKNASSSAALIIRRAKTVQKASDRRHHRTQTPPPYVSGSLILAAKNEHPSLAQIFAPVPLVVDGNHFASSVSAERLQLLYSVRHYNKTITHLNALLDAPASLKLTRFFCTSKSVKNKYITGTGTNKHGCFITQIKKYDFLFLRLLLTVCKHADYSIEQ
jgi:hypothetical protein